MTIKTRLLILKGGGEVEGELRGTKATSSSCSRNEEEEEEETCGANHVAAFPLIFICL